MAPKQSIVIPTSVNRPNQGSIYDNEPPLEPWHGQFSSSRLGPMVIKGQIRVQGRCPVSSRLPYTTKVYITYLGVYKHKTTIEVEAVITPSGQMMVKVGDEKEPREIVFTTDVRSPNEASGHYRVISGPMQDQGTFRLARGSADYTSRYM
jgi:hypothetical protein